MRDYIYMDTERIKSFVAQAEGGLPQALDRQRDTGSQYEGSASVEGKAGSIARLLADVGVSGELGASLLLTKSEKESYTLHDALYDRLETLLREQDAGMVDVPESATPDEWRCLVDGHAIVQAAIVRVSGQVHIWDYARIGEMIANFENLGEAVLGCNLEGQLANLADPEAMTPTKQQSERKKLQRELEQKMGLKGMKRMCEHLGTVMRLLFGTPLIMRFLPVPESPEIRIVCLVQEEYLRESKDAILFKYGMVPPHPWTVVGQVASMPPPDYDPQHLQNVFGNEILDVLSGMFQAFSGFEQFGLTVRHPEIAVTPLVVYQSGGDAGHRS